MYINDPAIPSGPNFNLDEIIYFPSGNHFANYSENGITHRNTMEFFFWFHLLKDKVRFNSNTRNATHVRYIIKKADGHSAIVLPFLHASLEIFSLVDLQKNLRNLLFPSWNSLSLMVASSASLSCSSLLNSSRKSDMKKEIVISKCILKP